MTIKLQTPVRNTLTVDKARKLLELVNRKVASGEVGEPGQLLSSIFNSFRQLFAHLQEPVTGKLKLRSGDFRSPEEYTEFLRNVAVDLDVLLSSTRSLTEAAVETFNLAAVKRRSLRNRIAKISSYSADVQLLDNHLGTNTMVAGDDFSDSSRIDTTFPVDGSRTELLPGGLGIALKRTGSVSAIDPENVTIEVEKPASAYEGKYYAPLGQAEPEGGKFHWELGGRRARAKGRGSFDAASGNREDSTGRGEGRSSNDGKSTYNLDTGRLE